MARTRQRVSYLDTHVVVWLYEGLVEKLSASAKQAIEQSTLLFSPLVELELQYLHEIGRLSDRSLSLLYLDLEDWHQEETEINRLTWRELSDNPKRGKYCAYACSNPRSRYRLTLFQIRPPV